MDKLSGQRVLLIEDEALIAMETTLMLEEIGAVVVGPLSSLKAALYALDEIEAGAVDAVVLDINLSGTPSYPIADKLREMGLPFIFVTGYEKPEHHKDAPMLSKPIRLGPLLTKMSEILA